MFKNYFITSWRNLIRDKSYSSFNILGLAVGMGVALPRPSAWPPAIP
jgi:putative ABC transport system permease protein